jgi:hypothetical protein
MKTEFARVTAEVAERWSDPSYGHRGLAEAELLAGDGRYTQEGVAFAVNHAMEVLASGRLADWAGAATENPVTVGVVTGGHSPTEGLLEAVTAALKGHSVLIAAGSPESLVQRIVEEVNDACSTACMACDSTVAVLRSSDALIGIGTRDEYAAWDEQTTIPSSRWFMTPRGWGVAVLDGRETRADLSGLAEDAWLHDGSALESLRILWAPHDLEPDEVLDVFASFREIFPAHSSTSGGLTMPTAFLAAAKQPHAVGHGFLVSKGVPEPQNGAHLRWSGYASLRQVIEWIEAHALEIGYVAGRPQVLSQVFARPGTSVVATIGFGDAHRPEPGRYPLTHALRAFLEGL